MPAVNPDQILRRGVLFKKGSGHGPFGRKNWKPRYFVLRPRKISYYTFEDGELKGELDLTTCDERSLEVMPADSMKTGSSASTIWRIAINSTERRLIVAASTEMEMNDWVEKFVVAFRINSGAPLQQIMANHIEENSSSPPAIRDFQNFATSSHHSRRSSASGPTLQEPSTGHRHSISGVDERNSEQSRKALELELESQRIKKREAREFDRLRREQQLAEKAQHETATQPILAKESATQPILAKESAGAVQLNRPSKSGLNRTPNVGLDDSRAETEVEVVRRPIDSVKATSSSDIRVEPTEHEDEYAF